ncbi:MULTISPECIES: hypothetical protein [Streptomyces]|uniref:Phosphoadenosine phosphosulphate reductase domain-containing protein n=1 Tax=Streptomyces canarius TaxID=285453 RepID=A0ABQ3D0T3_9ACTN|nr:hypothetical protein [Streptomyces canarius]GHA51360.1 hypothetical protein GCM10010345_64770 [Streptomyces canarius]
MPSTAFTPSLPGLAADDELDTVINWGLGADSTAYLARMLIDPAAHGIDLARTAVLYMATGSEWPETRLLCEEFMLPLLRSRGVRIVQLARAGHLKADGITVLDDSRRPERLFARGLWTLWDELESVGSVPQQAGVRKCSLRAKGEVGDRWITQVFGGRPFRQIMGFNADEEGRRFGDQAASKVPGRTGVFRSSTGAGTGSSARPTSWTGSACTGRSRTAPSAASPPPWARCPPTWNACAPTRTSPVRCCAWSTRR